MMRDWYLVFASALGVSFACSLALTTLIRRLAVRWNVLDHPGDRKMHASPVPLMGGVAIFVTFCIVVIGNFLLLRPVRQFGFVWFEQNVVAFLGEHVRIKLTGIFAGGFIIFLLGFVDDVKALRPEIKLLGQIAAALVLVLSGIRLDLFIDNVLIGTGLGEFVSEQAMSFLNASVSGLATVVWVVMMTNSLNFLDNMDGLCGGVSVIAALSLFLCILPHGGSGDVFISVLLVVFAGSVAGFLYHNLNPARIFMGDAGAMFCGYLLSTAAVLATFYTESAPSRLAVIAPLLALSVPIFDTLSVIYIRWRKGESIMRGDKRHFSHRLMDLGMSSRQAVEFIFLVAGVTGLGAVALPHVGRGVILLILAQTAGVFCLIVILMNAGKNGKRPGTPD